MNYQKELEKIIEKNINEHTRPTLLLHVCCAPCSSYCLEYLKDFFDITVYYYNPNITDSEEFYHRLDESKRLTSTLSKIHDVDLKYDFGEYDDKTFFEMVNGYENEPEGGARGDICFSMRLDNAAKKAHDGGFDYFTTSLTISPMKSADKLNKIGEACGNKYGVKFLPSDFKKKNGYKRSVELSKEFDLYRQDYCGCEFSKRDQIRRQNAIN